MSDELVVIGPDGMEHDLAWLQANYGTGLHVVRADAPCWRLQQVIIDTSGDVNLKAWVHDANGLPRAGVSVTYAFPSLENPSPDLPDIPLVFITRGGGRGVLNKNVSGGDGLVSFQIWDESWIKNQVGPYQVWVLSTSMPSDIFVGAGWLGGTNHHGPVQFVFRQVSAASPTDYKTLEDALRGEAEAHDVLRINPGAALCKSGDLLALWPTSNEFIFTFDGTQYVAQRFRNPGNDDVYVLYCVVGQYHPVERIMYRP